MNRQNAIVGIFALTCVAGLAIYLWACRSILHRAEAAFSSELGPETSGDQQA